MKLKDIDGELLDIDKSGDEPLYYYQLATGEYATYVKNDNGEMIRID